MSQSFFSSTQASFFYPGNRPRNLECLYMAFSDGFYSYHFNLAVVLPLPFSTANAAHGFLLHCFLCGDVALRHPGRIFFYCSRERLIQVVLPFCRFTFNSGLRSGCLTIIFSSWHCHSIRWELPFGLLRFLCFSLKALNNYCQTFRNDMSLVSSPLCYLFSPPLLCSRGYHLFLIKQ